MGRKTKSFVWEHFTEVTLKGKSVHICNYCGLTYCFKNVTKKCNHLLKCPKCPIEVRQSVGKEAGRQEDNHEQFLVDVSASHNPTEGQSSSQSKSPCISLAGSPASIPDDYKEATILNKFLDHMSPTQQERANEKLCRFIYVTGVSPRLLEDEDFIDFLNYVHSAFQLPKRKALSTTYLEKEFNSVKTDVNNLVTKSSHLNLHCDGWSNLGNESILNFLLCTPNPIFVKCVYTNANRNNARYLCREIKKVMKEYGADKFFVLIGDNASDMQKAFQEVQQEYPNVVTLGCLAHTLHSMCEDILKCSSVGEFFDEVVNIINTIWQSQILSATFTEIQDINKCKVSLKLPEENHWGSHLFSLESLLQNKKSLQQLATRGKVANGFQHKSDILLKLKLLDENFWDIVEKMIPLLKTAVTWITMLKGDEPLIHRVKEAIEEVEKNLNLIALCNSFLIDDEKSTLIRKLQETKDKAVKPIHLAAILLDPTSIGSNLSASEVLDAQEFIDSTATSMENVDSKVVYEDLILYMGKSGKIWGRDFVWKYANKKSPLRWWQGIYPETPLSKVAKRILSAPVTSASTKRTFSTFSRLHSKIRDGLTAERATKLTYISHNWKQLHCNESKIVKSGELMVIIADAGEDEDQEDEEVQEDEEEDEKMTDSEEQDYYDCEWLEPGFENM